MVTSFKRSHDALLHSAPDPAAGPRRPTPPPETPGHSRASLGQSPVGSLLLSPGSGCTRFCCALQESISRCCVSSGGSMVGLMATSSKRAYTAPRSAAQSPCPCGRPLLSRSSAADTQTQFWLSLCGVPGSWCAQSMFEPSECLWQEWGLILNMMSPLLPSCWGFSFALGHGVNIYIFLNICRPIMLLLPWRYSKLSRVRLFATPWTVAHRASLSMGFSRQEY